MENTVDMMATQVQDDAALTAQEPQTLADVVGSTNEQQPVVEADVTAEQPPQTEPGWMKKRVGAAVNKAVAEAEARLRAEYEAQLAPFREMQLEAEADKLVADGVITKREVAFEFVRNRRGLPAKAEPTPATPSTPPRDEQGRFVAKNPEPNAAVKQRANMLFAQAGNIKDATGVDVMAIYNSDPDVKAKVLSGEWDFTNVLMQYKAEEPADAPAHTAPAPVRSANGIGMGGVDIRHMSGEQFRKLNEFLASGGRVDVRK